MNEKQWDGTLHGREVHIGSSQEAILEAELAEYQVPRDLEMFRRGEEYIKSVEQRIGEAKKAGTSPEEIQELEESLIGLREAVERFSRLLNETLDHTPGESDDPESRTYH